MRARSAAPAKQSEVKDINKQRFLPELGKLLTFMVEEDRQTALAMYSRLFDDAEDEQKLMELLVSPTRQAVVIARTYDARERKQQLEAPNQNGAEQTPAFVLAIDRLYQQVAPRAEEQPAEEEQETPALVNQFSLFEDDVHPIDDSEYVPFQIEAEAVSIEEPVEALPVEPEPVLAETPEEPEPAPAADEEAAPAELPEEPAQEAAPAESEPEVLAPVELAMPVEAAPAPMEQRAAAPEETPTETPSSDTDVPQTHDLYDVDYLPETRRKPRVFLLILYVLFAVPLTLAGVILLLLPTVLVLALAVGVIVVGSAALVSAFSGFPKLADILIILGAAVIVLALGLLLLWLFVWFIGGAIGGLIRGAVNLGRKWCYEEVPV